MQYDFDNPPEQRGMDSLKWARYAGRDVLPMWVADMEFAAPTEVLDALRRRLDHGVLGYAQPEETLNRTVCAALQRDHGWSVDPDWLLWLPGVVPGMAACCRIAGEPGDEVLTSPPIYHHFLRVAQPAGRSLLSVPLRRDEAGEYGFDMDALRAAIGPRTRLLLLCNPHNPVGRVYRREELRALLELCAEHDLLICSDEIHCDLVLDESARHLPSALVLPEYAERMITLMAASKTFNLAGMNCAFAVIPDARLRRRVREVCQSVLPMPNALGLVASGAAYRHGVPWRSALLDYLRGNRALIEAELGGVADIELLPTQATYLAWMKVDGLGLDDALGFFERAGVGLSGGEQFGDGDYLRLNFACSRSMLGEALGRMRRALDAG